MSSIDKYSCQVSIISGIINLCYIFSFKNSQSLNTSFDKHSRVIFFYLLFALKIFFEKHCKTYGKKNVILISSNVLHVRNVQNDAPNIQM